MWRLWQHLLGEVEENHDMLLLRKSVTWPHGCWFSDESRDLFYLVCFSFEIVLLGVSQMGSHLLYVCNYPTSVHS
jgi:hypothetical protein